MKKKGGEGGEDAVVDGGGVLEDIEQQKLDEVFPFELLREKRKKKSALNKTLQTNNRPLCPCWSSDM